MDRPVHLRLRPMERDRAVAGPHRQVTIMRMQFEEVTEDGLFLMPERDDELVHAVGFVMLHDMPDDRPSTDLDQGLGLCRRSDEHTSELQSLMRISYAVFCLKKQTNKQ